MNSVDIKQIKTILEVAHQFKAKIIRIADDLKNIQENLLKSLQAPNESTTSSSSEYSFVDSDQSNERLCQVSNDILNEHKNLARPSLVIFGPNSSGKTTFIQRFADIGNILPCGIGSVTTRIVQLTYAPAENARFCIYKTIDKHSIEFSGDLSQFFTNPQEPNWKGISDTLSIHLQRPTNIERNSDDFIDWTKCLVEVAIPSKLLELNIDIYDTPGFLSDNREQILTDNLHNLVKSMKPTLIFLYDNATISDTDKNCFLAMKNALGSLERVPIFFLNTKADCISIANDYSLDDDPENITEDEFCAALLQKRQNCYNLLLRRREMANELLGALPNTVDECKCFDICTIPTNFDPWERYTNVINETGFRRIIEFAAESYTRPSLSLAHDILGNIEDYFDLLVSKTIRLPHEWDSLRDEALQWGELFFKECEQVLPKLIDNLVIRIFDLLAELQEDICRQAAMTSRNDDPIDILLRNNYKAIKDYVRVAVEEQVIKVAVNEIIIENEMSIKSSIERHFQNQKRKRKNELLTIAQRHVLRDISTNILQRIGLFHLFLENLLKLPMRISYFIRSLPTRISAYQKDLYNRFIQERLDNIDDDIYKLLDAMDTYATLSNENNRKTFANVCLTKFKDKLEAQKPNFARNLIIWNNEQKMHFIKNVKSNYYYFRKSTSSQQALYNRISKFSVAFAKIECQLLAAEELLRRHNTVPVIGEEIGRGGFYSVHAATWDSERNLVVKKPINPIGIDAFTPELEAHYHRAVTSLCPECVVPLLYIYENSITSNEQELWFIMPRYTKSLQKYLMENIKNLSFSRTLAFALQIAKILAKLHSLEIVYRDLKSSNIMLDDNEQCYFIDFGTMRYGSSSKTLLGTLPLPPEISVIFSNPTRGCTTNYDGTLSDIYSFGLLLYELLQKSEYNRLTISTIARIDELLKFCQLSDISTQQYESLIRKCLDSNPQRRPKATQLIHELELIENAIETKPCITCEEEARIVRCLPCGHKSMCRQCWATYRSHSSGNVECILCKINVTDSKEDNIGATFYQPKT